MKVSGVGSTGKAKNIPIAFFTIFTSLKHGPVLMKILLVSATYAEVKPLVEPVALTTITEGQFYRLRFQEPEINLLITGIGMIPTAFCLGKFLPGGSYHLAVQAGVCGSYEEHLVPGSVVNVTEECLPEVGVTRDGEIRSLFHPGLIDPNGFPFENGKLVNRTCPSLQCLGSLPSVSGNTVHTLRTDPREIRQLKKQFPASVESMEGAAFLYACLREHIPCIQTRAVSNYAGQSNPSEWKLAQAIRNLADKLAELLEELRMIKSDQATR